MKKVLVLLLLGLVGNSVSGKKASYLMTGAQIIKAHRAAINDALKITNTSIIQLKKPEAVEHYGEPASKFLSEYKTHKEKLLKDFDEFKKKDDYPSLKDLIKTKKRYLLELESYANFRIDEVRFQLNMNIAQYTAALKMLPKDRRKPVQERLRDEKKLLNVFNDNIKYIKFVSGNTKSTPPDGVPRSERKYYQMIHHCKIVEITPVTLEGKRGVEDIEAEIAALEQLLADAKRSN